MDGSLRGSTAGKAQPFEPAVLCIVHPVTKNTLANFLTFLRRAAASQGISLHVADHWDPRSVEEERGIIAMGEKLTGLDSLRPQSVTWINWSVLVPVRGLLHTSLAAYLWMRRKRQRFMRNSRAFRCVYDFYPAHTRVLKSRWPQLSVATFPIGLYDEQRWRMVRRSARYDYDVCVVGADSPRRRRVRNALATRGISLSPTTGDLEELIERSRLVLNVHRYRCDNCEAHRILSAYAHGRIVISEHIFGLAECLDPRWVITAKLHEIPGLVWQLSREPREIEALGQQAYEYYWGEFWPHALMWWGRMLLSELEKGGGSPEGATE